MKLITRNVINKDITFIDVDIYNIYHKEKRYNFTDLERRIHIVKNILQNQYNCKEGQSVLIGITPSILQIAAFFACAELGLTVVIADHSRNDNWIDANYVDPKTKSLLPINYFIVTSDGLSIPKYKLFYSICDHTVTIRDIDNLDSTENRYIGCLENSVLLKCTSSGTTGTAKVINHTHEFFYDLIKRNSSSFYGNICMAHNLNHGSSPATYFLPSIAGESTKTFSSFMITYVTDKFDQEHKKLSMKRFHAMRFDHLMIPYSYMIDDFLKECHSPDLNLYTLSTIKKSWLPYFLDGRVKNIISIFGSNETSGPTFTNEIADHAFEENKYRLVDDFYHINLIDDKLLEVHMPVYGTKIITNDVFDKVGNDYYHRGRNDLYRVNGHEVNVNHYTTVIKDSLDGDLIIDTTQDGLYLAIWNDQISVDIVSDISDKIKKASYGVHTINKHAVLDKVKFMSGVKLDMELLRDYFRKFV